jgi:Kef-type K+ transport system membrane component KefB
VTEAVLAAPAPLAPHQLLIFLLQVSLLLLVATLLGRLAERLRMPAIVGELFTGLLLGPSVFGTLTPGITGWLLPDDASQSHLLAAVAQIGVLLLVGLTGAHLDLAMLRRRGTTAMWVSLFGLVVALAMGIATGWILPGSLAGDGTQRWVFALFIGVAMCVTAIPVIAKTLADLRLTHRDVGQLTLVAGTVDDAVGWFLLSIVSAAATVGITAAGVSRSVAYLVGFTLLAALVGRRLVGGVMRLADRSADSGTTAAVAMVLILLGAATTSALGMEPVFGAFVVGILIGAPGAANHFKLAPLRTVTLSVLAPIFMATAGLGMDLTVLADPAIALAGLGTLAVAVIGKFTGAYIGARIGRLGRWEALAIGAGMNARGVIEVIVAMVGLRLGVLNTASYTIVVLIAIATSLMAPPLLRMAMRRVAHTQEERARKATEDAWAGRPAQAAVDS